MAEPDSFDIEFHAIFDRVSGAVDLKGAYGVSEINQRIEHVIFYLEGTKAIMKERGKKVPKRLEYDQEQLEKLLAGNRFASRTTSELISNPYGKVALTIRYDRKRAREILLKRARERHGKLRYYRRR